jgi:tetratricopeptide (TPR) repeat protein
MEERFKTYEYQITTDPKFQNEDFGITPELERQLESLAIGCRDRMNKKIIDKLTQLIIQYPTVPMLKNYLSVAYDVQGNHKKAMEVNNWIIAEHPDYLWAKINQANFWIEEKNTAKVPEILGEAMDIKQLYPDRDLFHLSEVTGFFEIAIRYFAAIENLEQAEIRLKILKEIAPDHPDTQQAEYYLFALRLKNAPIRWKKEQEERISPEIIKKRKPSNKNEAPLFNHPEINNLYHFGIRIPHEILKEILALPRQTLIADLELVINDSIERYDHFKELKYNEETTSFLLHAVFLLKELKSEESLPKVLAFLESDNEFLDFWLGDHITASVWQCLYDLGMNKTSILKEFLLKPGIDTYCKTAVSETLCQMVLHNPEKKEEIAAIFSEVFTQFAEASLEDNLLDTDFLGLAIGGAFHCHLDELLPIIKTLYEKQYVALGINGDYNAVEKYFSKPSVFNHKRNTYTIFELYDNVLSTWSGYNEEKNEYSHLGSIPPEPAKSEKIGRNDDCPCGSGKKYKKCCMK